MLLGIRIYILPYSSGFLPAHAIAFSQRRYSNPRFISSRSLCQHIIPYIFKSRPLPTSPAPGKLKLGGLQKKQNRRYRFPVSHSRSHLSSRYCDNKVMGQMGKRRLGRTQLIVPPTHPLPRYTNTSYARGTIHKVGLRDMIDQRWSCTVQATMLVAGGVGG